LVLRDYLKDFEGDEIRETQCFQKRRVGCFGEVLLASRNPAAETAGGRHETIELATVL